MGIKIHHVFLKFLVLLQFTKDEIISRMHLLAKLLFNVQVFTEVMDILDGYILNEAVYFQDSLI